MSRPLVTIGTALTLALFTFPIILATLADGPLFYYRSLVLLADLPLALAAGAVAAGGRSMPAVVRIGLALAATLLATTAIHPSPEGLQVVCRVTLAVGLAAAIRSLAEGPVWPLVPGTLAVAALLQAGLAVAQLVHGGPLGLPAVGEFADPLYQAGTRLAPRGTMYQQYLLAGLALLAALLLIAQGLRGGRARWVWYATAALAATPVGLTYSRSALLGAALALGAIGLGARHDPRRHVPAILALLLGIALPAVLTIDGWTTPSDKGFDPNGRDVLLREGLALYATAPLSGIGPGRMVLALDEQERSAPGSVLLRQPVHDVPVLLLVEAGPVAAGLSLALLTLTAWRIRRSPAALALFAAYLPFVILDHFPYTHAQGLVLTAIWLGGSWVLAADT